MPADERDEPALDHARGQSDLRLLIDDEAHVHSSLKGSGLESRSGAAVELPVGDESLGEQVDEVLIPGDREAQWHGKRRGAAGLGR